MKPKRKFRARTGENLFIVAFSVLTFAIGMIGHHYGFGRKWDAAMVETGSVFGIAMLTYRRWWRRQSFWLSFCLCLLVHSLALCLLINYILANVVDMGALALAPLGFVEIFVLLFAIIKVEHAIFGKNDSVRLT